MFGFAGDEPPNCSNRPALQRQPPTRLRLVFNEMNPPHGAFWVVGLSGRGAGWIIVQQPLPRNTTGRVRAMIDRSPRSDR
jgi:hypothetical protein